MQTSDDQIFAENERYRHDFERERRKLQKQRQKLLLEKEQMEIDLQEAHRLQLEEASASKWADDILTFPLFIGIVCFI